MLCDQPDGLLYKINLTRQQLQDETSINVKTLNRTISQLKEEGFISLEKGKICYYKENYKKAVTWLQEAAAANGICLKLLPPLLQHFFKFMCWDRMGKPVSLYFITHGISKDGRLFRRLNSLTYNMITKTF